MKNFLRLIALILLVSCNPVSPTQTPGPEVVIPPAVEEPIHEPSKPIGPEYPIADAKKIFTVKIVDTNYTKAQREKLDKAEKLLATIINSEEFKAEILKRKFTSTTKTSEEVFDKIFRGAEALQPAVNYQMDLKVEMYLKKTSRVVGYTNGKTLFVYTNAKYHNYYTPCQVASNSLHEWSHKLGFDHSSAKDSTSVPYSMNAIVEKLCPKIK